MYSSQGLNMHLLSCLIQLTIAMSLYKDMPSWNTSSHFTHTLSLHSRTHIFNMSCYLLPAWNEHPLCHCQWWAKMTISLMPTTHGRRCWGCPDTDPSGYVGFYLLILYFDGSNWNTATNIDGLISAFEVKRSLWRPTLEQGWLMLTRIHTSCQHWSIDA
jgi:hypothetical protein